MEEKEKRPGAGGKFVSHQTSADTKVPTGTKIESKSIIIAAISLALTVALAPIPVVFMLPLLFICTTRGMKMSLFMGLSFGVVSFLYSLMGGSPVAVAFANAPWIAIVPRIFVAFFAHGAFVLSKKFIKGNSKIAKIAPYAISAAIGSVSNTAMVVSLLAIFMSGTAFGDVTIYLYIPTMLISGVIELVAYSVLVPTVSISVNKAVKISTVKSGKKIKREEYGGDNNNSEKEYSAKA